MYTRKLGPSSLEVSRFCLGSMTFGEQNDQAGAELQLDRARAAGINFIDSAEMYPAPARAESSGDSERCIGRWLAARGCRDAFVLATKAAGPGAFLPWLRNGQSRHDQNNLTRAVDGSLQRLRTDYIDLYQLHWPDRASNFFGQLGFKPARQETDFDIAASVRALAALVASGKVRYLGLCNETPWGVMEFLRVARAEGVAGIVSVQNPYNLLNRSAEVGLTEVLWREGLSLLAYSPLAFGLLSGKYHDGSAGAEARLQRYTQYKRYNSERGMQATARYLAIAREAGLDPAHMALAWNASKPWVGSVIIGQTSIAQLEHNLEALNFELPRAVEKAIDAVHEEISNPCP